AVAAVLRPQRPRDGRTSGARRLRRDLRREIPGLPARGHRLRCVRGGGRLVRLRAHLGRRTGPGHGRRQRHGQGDRDRRPQGERGHGRPCDGARRDGRRSVRPHQRGHRRIGRRDPPPRPRRDRYWRTAIRGGHSRRLPADRPGAEPRRHTDARDRVVPLVRGHGTGHHVPPARPVPDGGGGGAMSAALTLVLERRTALVSGVVLVVLALAPLLGASLYTIVILTSVLAYALLAMSINLVAGYTGLLTLCHAAYAGVGAYASVLVARHLTHNGMIQLLAGVVMGAAVAALTGWIAVRASKTFFLMLSLAIGELLHILAVQWSSVTKGDNGLSAGAPLELVPGSPISLAGYVYWVAFGVFAVFAGLTLLVTRSPFGSALRGIRDNEPRMRALGYPTS